MKKYDDNIPLLKNRVETHAFIRNISKHRLPDGTLDVEGNLKLWSDGMQGFVKTPLWEKTLVGEKILTYKVSRTWYLYQVTQVLQQF